MKVDYQNHSTSENLFDNLGGAFIGVTSISVTICGDENSDERIPYQKFIQIFSVYYLWFFDVLWRYRNETLA